MHKNLTLITTNTKHINRLNGSLIKYDINVLRGLADLIANLFNTKFDYFTSLESQVFYANEMLAINHTGQLIGYIGLIKTSKLKTYGLNDLPVYCLSLNFELLIDLYTKPSIKFTSVSDLMPINKDVSFYVKPSTRINIALNAIQNLPFVHNYEFIDRFINSNGEVSYTIRFQFNNEKNLLTQTIDQYYKSIVNILIEHNCLIRK
jgi:phenylalanyl-tRNA synthetase beta subunit